MKVLKFGTTAIATPEKFRIVAQIVNQTSNSIVVLSAMAGTTHLLEEISDYLYKKNPEGANEVINQLESDYLSKIEELFLNANIKDEAIKFLKERISYIRGFTKDLFTLFEERIILAQGEIFSSGLFTLMLKEADSDIFELPAFEFMRIDKKREPDSSYIRENLLNLIKKHKAEIYITQGYICKNNYDEVDNFEFGGSDYTASLIGAAIHAKEIQIWTDIDAMYNNDSHLISNSQTVHNINFDEAAELAYFGAKILHPLCILPAKMTNIPVRLLNIHDPKAFGTLISNQTEKEKIKAIASKSNITVINIKSSRMLLAHGFLRKVCEVFEHHQTSIDMLTTSEVGVSVTIDNLRYLNEITNDLKTHGTVLVENDMAIICVVGDLNWQNANQESQILDSFKNIPIRMISYGGSNSNISFLIKDSDHSSAIDMLNKKLFQNN